MAMNSPSAPHRVASARRANRNSEAVEAAPAAMSGLVSRTGRVVMAVMALMLRANALPDRRQTLPATAKRRSSGVSWGRPIAESADRSRFDQARSVSSFDGLEILRGDEIA